MKLNSTLFALLIGATIGVSSCHTSENAVSYKKADRYFVRNDVKDHSPRLIQSEEELNQYFGKAPVMGKNGAPTNIDFTKYNAIAIIEAETNRDTEIKITSIKNHSNKIVVKYKAKQKGEPLSYTMVPSALYQIDKKYGNNIAFVKE